MRKYSYPLCRWPRKASDGMTGRTKGGARKKDGVMTKHLRTNPRHLRPQNQELRDFAHILFRFDGGKRRNVINAYRRARGDEKVMLDFVRLRQVTTSRDFVWLLCRHFLLALLLQPPRFQHGGFIVRVKGNSTGRKWCEGTCRSFDFINERAGASTTHANGEKYGGPVFCRRRTEPTEEEFQEARNRLSSSSSSSSTSSALTHSNKNSRPIQKEIIS